jgi:hypothetical protein
VSLKLHIQLCHLDHYINKSSLYKLATENELNYEPKGDCKLSSAQSIQIITTISKVGGQKMTNGQNNTAFSGGQFS